MLKLKILVAFWSYSLTTRTFIDYNKIIICETAVILLHAKIWVKK